MKQPCIFVNFSFTFSGKKSKQIQFLRRFQNGVCHFLPFTISTHKAKVIYFHCSKIVWYQHAKLICSFIHRPILDQCMSVNLTLLPMANLIIFFKQWKGINRKQSTRWQHLSQLKASVFFSFQKKFNCYETQRLILGTGTAFWWVTEPH